MSDQREKVAFALFAEIYLGVENHLDFARRNWASITLGQRQLWYRQAEVALAAIRGCVIERVLQYPLGSVLQFTKGQYSDFRTCGLLVAIQPLDLPKLAQEMNAGKDKYSSGQEMKDFASWLVAQGYAMPVDASEVHLGDYDWEPEFGVKYAGDD